MPKSIAILMGAGFSAPIGYPAGYELGAELIEKQLNNIEIQDLS